MRQIWFIGIDEVGRGPLAGPITLAAVAARMPKSQVSIFNKVPVSQFPGLSGIRDSKKLSVLQREHWGKLIRQNFTYAISSVHPRTIDKKGISHAAHLAAYRCLRALTRHCTLNPEHCFVFLDGGLHAPSLYKNQQTIIKGDERVPIIAAASIIAKVHRDNYMRNIHRKFPDYGFDRHKGYGTLMHREAIMRCGLSGQHRVSFCKNITSSQDIILT